MPSGSFPLTSRKGMVEKLSKRHGIKNARIKRRIFIFAVKRLTFLCRMFKIILNAQARTVYTTV